MGPPSTGSTILAVGDALVAPQIVGVDEPEHEPGKRYARKVCAYLTWRLVLPKTDAIRRLEGRMVPLSEVEKMQADPPM